MKVFICSILFLLCFVVNAQPPRNFHTKTGANGYDVGYDLKQTLDNAYILTGSTSSFGQGNTDFYLVKLDSVGNKKFEKTFGDYNNESANSIIQLPDSSYVMAGYTNSVGFGGYDIYIVKADKNGNFISQKNIGGSDWDFGNCIYATNDGGFIVCGTTYSFGRGIADGYVIKMDAGANVAWSKTYGGKFDDEFKSVIQTSDGGYALTGYSKSCNDSINGDCWVFKLDANGDSTWCKFYGGNKEDFGNHIVENTAGEFFIAGATESSGAGKLDAWAFKLNNTGSLTANFVDGTAGNDEIYTSVAISKRNTINRVCFSEKENFPGYNLQIKTIEFDFGLNYQNASDHGATQADETYKLIPTNDKGYAMAGYTYGFSAILTDCYFIKIDSGLVGGPSIVSVKELELADVKFELYPNPVSDVVSIEANLSVDQNNIQLFDISGNEIYLKNDLTKISNNHITVNLKDIHSGVYFLKCINRVKKITVIH